jgi:hypothetical protein
MGVVARWAAAGVACGVLARVAMALLTRRSEPTVSGTVSILLVFTVAGLAIGVVRSAWEAGRSPWTRIVGLLGLGVFGGAGALLFPSTLVAGVALGRLRSTRLRRLAAAIVVLWVAGVCLASGGDDDPFGLRFSSARFISGTVLMAVVGMVMAYGASQLVRPWRSRP